MKSIAHNRRGLMLPVDIENPITINKREAMTTGRREEIRKALVGDGAKNKMIPVDVAALARFEKVLSRAGIVPAKGVIADGKIHRCPTTDKPRSRNGAYLFRSENATGGYQNFGNAEGWILYRDNSLKRSVSPSEWQRQKLAALEAQRQRDQEIQSRQREAAVGARRIWANAEPANDRHGYLLKKRVRAHSLRVHNDGRLIVPLYDERGEIVSLQFIDRFGSKRFLSNGRLRGCYFQIGKVTDRLCVVEGFATGATIFEATGVATIIAFNANNLVAVAQLMRQRHPEVAIVICGDNDVSTEARTGTNPGIFNAMKAARAVDGRVVVPRFKDGQQGSDFNDLLAGGAA